MPKINYCWKNLLIILKKVDKLVFPNDLFNEINGIENEKAKEAALNIRKRVKNSDNMVESGLERYYYEVLDSFDKGYHEKGNDKCPMCGSAHDNLIELIEERKKTHPQKQWRTKQWNDFKNEITDTDLDFNDVKQIFNKVMAQSPTWIQQVLIRTRKKNFESFKRKLKEINEINAKISKKKAENKAFLKELNSLFENKKNKIIKMFTINDKVPTIELDDDKAKIRYENLGYSIEHFSLSEKNHLRLINSILTAKVNKKSTLILDDPYSSLDLQNRSKIAWSIAKIIKDKIFDSIDKIIILTHSPEFINDVCFQTYGKSFANNDVKLVLLDKSSNDEKVEEYELDLQAIPVENSDDGQYLDYLLKFTANEIENNEGEEYTFMYTFAEEGSLNESDTINWKKDVTSIEKNTPYVIYVNNEFELEKSYDFWVSCYNSTETQPANTDLYISKQGFTVRNLIEPEITNLNTTNVIQTLATITFDVVNPDNASVTQETTRTGGTDIKTAPVKEPNNQYTINLTGLVPNTQYTTVVTVGRVTDELDWSTINKTLNLGVDHSSLLTSDGKLFMWGANVSGQLGNGNTNDIDTPTNITDKFRKTNLIGAQIFLKGNFSSLLTSDGELFMWGWNDNGQLGNGGYNW